MAFSLTSRVNANNGASSSQTLTSSSFTPTANSRLFIFAAGERDAHVSAQSWSISNTGGLSFTLLDTSTIYSWNGDSNYALNSVCWYADVGASPSSMTVTVDPFTGTETAFISLIGFDVTGYDSGTPFAQASVDDGAQLGGGDSETDSIALGSAPTSGNLVVVFAGAGADSGGAISTPTGYTALISQNNSYTQAACFYHTSTTTASVTISDFGQSVGNWGGIIYEMTLGGAATLTINKSESITVTENVSLAVGSPQVNKSESITVSENVNVQIVLDALSINVSDSISVSENHAETVGSPQVNVSDSISVTESSNVNIVTGALTINVSDSVSVAENIGAATAALSITVSDNVYVAEPGFVGFATLAINVSDSITVTENAAASLPDALAISTSDAVTVTENTGQAIVTTVSVNDTITVAENVAGAVGVTINTSDSVTLSESVAASVLSAGALGITVSDSITVSENASPAVSAPQISLSDNISVTENIGADVTIVLQVSDSVSVTESVVLALGALAVAAQDNISVAEAVSVNMPSSITYNANNAVYVQFRDKRVKAYFRDKRIDNPFRDKRVVVEE